MDPNLAASAISSALVERPEQIVRNTDGSAGLCVVFEARLPGGTQVFPHLDDGHASDVIGLGSRHADDLAVLVQPLALERELRLEKPHAICYAVTISLRRLNNGRLSASHRALEVAVPGEELGDRRA